MAGEGYQVQTGLGGYAKTVHVFTGEQALKVLGEGSR